MLKVKDILEKLKDFDLEDQVFIPHAFNNKAVDFPSILKSVTVDIDGTYYLGDLTKDFPGTPLKKGCLIDYF